MDQHPWRLSARGRWWFDASLTLGLLVPGVVGHLLAGQPLRGLALAHVADVVPDPRRPTIVRTELAVLELVNGKNTVKDIVRKSRMGSSRSSGIGRWPRT